MRLESEKFIRLIQNPFKFRLYLFSKIPSAYFSGLRVKEISEKSCTVTVPYKWFSKNPFRSTYFACLAMAAEMSSGLLAMLNVYERRPAISMLVTKMESAYFRKATGIIQFTCEDGDLLKDIIEKAFETGEPYTCLVKSTGRKQYRRGNCFFYNNLVIQKKIITCYKQLPFNNYI